MDRLSVANDYPGMARSPRPQYRPLFIGPWIIRLGRKPSEIAKAVGVGESYLSLLISGDKKNPSGALLLAISEELGISVNDLYRRPPSQEVTDAVTTLRPDQVAALGELLDSVRGKKPPKDQ